MQDTTAAWRLPPRNASHTHPYVSAASAAPIDAQETMSAAYSSNKNSPSSNSSRLNLVRLAIAQDVAAPCG